MNIQKHATEQVKTSDVLILLFFQVEETPEALNAWQRWARKFKQDSWNYTTTSKHDFFLIISAFLALIVVSLIFIYFVLDHIAKLDDEFCGCVFCQLQNSTFCDKAEFKDLKNSEIIFYGILK